MKVRLVQESDLQKLAKIYVEAYNSLNIGENWNEETALKLMSWYHNKQADLFFVAEEDQVVGAIVAEVKPWWDGNHIMEGELFVHPDFQKHGIGKKLIKELFETASRKYQALSWDTFTHIIHEHPMQWYKKLGFTETPHWRMITGDIKLVLKKLQDS